MHTKITKQNVIDLLSNGWGRDLIVCGSKQSPYDKSVYLFNSNDFPTREHFIRWHEKNKKRICSEINGRSLRYYSVDKNVNIDEKLNSDEKQNSKYDDSKREYNRIKKRESRARLYKSKF